MSTHKHPPERLERQRRRVQREIEGWLVVQAAQRPDQILYGDPNNVARLAHVMLREMRVAEIDAEDRAWVDELERAYRCETPDRD